MPRKPKSNATTETAPNGGKLKLEISRDDKGKIWSYVRSKWLVEPPEERVRQEYVCVLVNEYGFDLAQMDEELHVAGRGSARARADVVIWRTIQDKTDAKAPLIVVECKADNITIKAADYAQGEVYALYCNAPFFVTHNNRETRYWRTRKERMPGHCEEIENIPRAMPAERGDGGGYGGPGDWLPVVGARADFSDKSILTPYRRQAHVARQMAQREKDS